MEDRSNSRPSSLHQPLLRKQPCVSRRVSLPLTLTPRLLAEEVRKAPKPAIERPGTSSRASNRPHTTNTQSRFDKISIKTRGYIQSCPEPVRENEPRIDAIPSRVPEMLQYSQTSHVRHLLHMKVPRAYVRRTLAPGMQPACTVSSTGSGVG
jgi:hypothetical protein